MTSRRLDQRRVWQRSRQVSFDGTVGGLVIDRFPPLAGTMRSPRLMSSGIMAPLSSRAP
jgi:hypothetical protein